MKEDFVLSSKIKSIIEKIHPKPAQIYKLMEDKKLINDGNIRADGI